MALAFVLFTLFSQAPSVAALVVAGQNSVLKEQAVRSESNASMQTAPIKMLNHFRRHKGHHSDEEHDSTSKETSGTTLSAQEVIDQRLVRPSAGKGPERIKFGMVTKNFYGTDLKQNRFTIDMVFSLRWKDARVAALIPEGQDKLVMSTQQSLKKVWSPQVVVTNRDIEMYEPISSSITIFSSGEVLRVERAMVRVLHKFEALDGYPFDTQDLKVIIASSKYMTDEVVLVPSLNKKVSGVEEDVWGNYNLLGWSTEAFEENDGDLKKSRGMMEIEVKRDLEKYRQEHLVPAMILIVVSWAVFYFPFAGPFITPRLALSILALLTFTNLIIKSGKALPGSAPFNWNDLFNQQVQIIMFSVIVINILTEIICHQLDVESVARSVNNQAKITIPGMTIINVAAIFTAASTGCCTLYHTALFTQVMVAVWLGGYAAWIYSITRAEMRANAKKDGVDEGITGAEAEAADEGCDEEECGEDGDADC